MRWSCAPVLPGNSTGMGGSSMGIMHEGPTTQRRRAMNYRGETKLFQSPPLIPARLAIAQQMGSSDLLMHVPASAH